MKKCKCGVSIEDKYQMCTKCNNEKINERANKNIEPEPTIIEKCNWNLGRASIVMELTLLNDLEKDGKTMSVNQQKIYDCLIKRLDKNIEAFTKIGKE